MSERIAWIDVETTGLDPKEDEVLEVAVIVTDMAGVEVVPRFRQIYACSYRGKRRLHENDFVTAMHEKSGLLTDMVLRGDERCSFMGLQSYLFKHATGAYLGGYSLHFDKSMLRAEGVDLSMTHHRVIDMTSVDLCLVAAGQPSVKPPKHEVIHRAMADCEEAIKSYKRALQVMK